MWALEPIFAKLAYQNSDFLHTSAVRAFVVAVIALIYVLITNKGSLKITKSQFAKIAYIGIVGTIGADLLFFYALTKVPVINAVLIGHMQPIFVVLIAFLVLKEDRLTKYDYFGILIMLTAGFLVTTKTPGNFRALKFGTWCDLILLSATFLWATTGIVMRKYLKALDAGVLTFYRYLIASVVFLIYLLSASSVAINSFYQIIVGVVVGIGTILYYESMKRIKAAQVSALELSTPFWASILGFIILREKITIMQVVGIVLLFAGVYFLSRKEEGFIQLNRSRMTNDLL